MRDSKVLSLIIIMIVVALLATACQKEALHKKEPITLKNTSYYYGTTEEIGQLVESELFDEQIFVAFFESVESEVSANKNDHVERFTRDFDKQQASNSLYKNEIVVSHDKNNHLEVSPVPYLKKIKADFPDRYLEKRLKEGIKFRNAYNISPDDSYYLKHISLIKEELNKYNLDFENEAIDYQTILAARHNQFIKDKDLVNIEYEYLIASEIFGRYNHNSFLQDTTDLFYGSFDDSNKEDKVSEIKKLEFWTGLGCINKRDNTIPAAKIKVNNHLIGQNLKRVDRDSNFTTLFFAIKRYEEIFIENNKKLQLSYDYYLPRILTGFFYSPKLEIRYRYKSGKQWEEDSWNKIIIEDFAADNYDYGIEISNFQFL